ncbi:dipeptide/oligopeptide/nickel ABC transporter permease/ATP-binding protein [Agromyces aerolatus]|uniref:dipeptide/oligopeptide/nickel ABC transporter permease/ATP-binding protein n=1 Tax=Agromyces sp. LY-1074 TaxID=3074080 RepID=UPI0028605ABF|nr:MULTISPECIES: dipeptide/oligopeptide/nickel ABC transporter permease/ATP-binding protein [unclassified Agromyces]MDR5699000.1 dipeptide/oligopeptide/nickel ABC transporter permease/ATP-binding protein [Agromyces sp. LY-1074]MDR5705222.1 dipeptide/oligopeptide/nickel ABC transporter permease/ATP-binding protein [Agromyces sp. LY-1358]
MSRNTALLRTPLGLVGTSLLALVLLTAVIAPIVWGEAAARVDTGAILEPPSAEHPIGTDSLGRDLLLRVLVATRLSVLLALGATAVTVTLGLVLGVVPVLFGERAGRATSWVIGIAVAFPGLLLALFFAVMFGSGWLGAVLAIGFAGAPAFARVCHTLIAGITNRDYIAAARIGGVSRIRVLFRHVLPNVGEPLIVNAAIGAGSALLAFAGLSFIGLGVQPPEYDWGRLMMEGLTGIYVNPLAALAPGIAVVVAGLAFNLTGEALARSLGVAPTVSSVRRRGPGRDAATRPNTLPGVPADEDLILDVQNLRVGFPGATTPLRPVRGVDLRVRRGEAVGIVGESGSGKSLTALAVAQLLEAPATVEADRLRFDGVDLDVCAPEVRRRLLGTSLAMVFQDPMSSFNPAKRMGAQLAEAATAHQRIGRAAAKRRAVQRLGDVRITEPDRRARQYPHEFSGGMRQRAMIGMGLMASPKLIIADEPTTAIDATVQRQVLDLLQSIRREDGVALLLISHDMSVVADVCDRVVVMYGGRIVEELPASDLRRDARHPYTRALLAAVPDMQTPLDLPLATIPGRPADPSRPDGGCAYAPRCPLADERCRTVDPPLAHLGPGRAAACWHPGETAPARPATVGAGAVADA